jgi:hypothetical protein
MRGDEKRKGIRERETDNQTNKREGVCVDDEVLMKKEE